MAKGGQNPKNLANFGRGRLVENFGRPYHQMVSLERGKNSLSIGYHVWSGIFETKGTNRSRKIGVFWPEIPKMPTPPPSPNAKRMREIFDWVRPYLVESTTSRPICEVKQLQA